MGRTLVAICAAVALVGCESERIRGDLTDFLGQPVAASAEPDGDRISRVFITLPIQAVKGTHEAVAVLPFPERVRNETFAQFFQIAAVGGSASFVSPGTRLALRYFGVPEATVNAVTCGAQPEVPASRLPPGFSLSSQLSGACVPGQAWRASGPSTSADHTVVVGYDAARLILIEVQLAPELLTARRPFILAIPRPMELGAAARYPTRFIGNYRTDLNAWEFALDEFEQIDQ